jgi:hypothetical protein
MRQSWKQAVVIVAAVIAWAVVILFFSGTSQVAHESLQYELNAIGQSIYEYHASTGRWPSGIDDLAETSLPLRLRYWKPILLNGSVVVVWHDNLPPDPKANAGVILAYHNRGLLAELGRQWVCWGDLRTEYISTKQLRAALNVVPH